LNEENEAIQALQHIGLTLNQARVYMALYKSGTSRAKTLSTISGLAPCDVYRVMEDLQKLGLVEVLITSPKKFRACSPDYVISTLISKRTEENRRIETEALDIVHRIKSEKLVNQFDGLEMTLIPYGKTISSFESSNFKTIKKRVDCVQTNRLFHRFIYDTHGALKELINRNVEMRFVVEDVEKLDAHEQLKALLKNGNFQVKSAKDKIDACIMLHDDTDVFVSKSTETAQTPSYWSNNPCIIGIVSTYFETKWNNSQDARLLI
jgi:sugar-specific transcriptional regulator TrmB